MAPDQNEQTLPLLKEERRRERASGKEDQLKFRL